MKSAYLIAILTMLVSSKCSLAVHNGHNEGPAGATLKIGNRTVLSAWQSSMYNNTSLYCFWGRSTQEEDRLVSSDISYQFVHSDYKALADDGYHWFVVQLKETMLMSAVSISGRNDSAYEAYNRSVGIEIWTSAGVVDFADVDHCFPRQVKISDRFKSSKSHWIRCGITRTRNGSVVKGEVLTVTCSAQVTMLLLRMFVTNRTDKYDDALSFAGIHLTIGQPSTTGQPTATKPNRAWDNDQTAGLTAAPTPADSQRFVQMTVGLCIAVLLAGLLMFLLLLYIVIHNKKPRCSNQTLTPGTRVYLPSSSPDSLYFNQDWRHETVSQWLKSEPSMENTYETIMAVGSGIRPNYSK